jgi:hypothetical protein
MAARTGARGRIHPLLSALLLRDACACALAAAAFGRRHLIGVGAIAVSPTPWWQTQHPASALLGLHSQEAWIREDRDGRAVSG